MWYSGVPIGINGYYVYYGYMEYGILVLMY
jgi:hypothetical protein